MANVFVRLLKAYRRNGFRIRTGLNPLYFDDPDAGFTRLFNDCGDPVSVGAGLAPQEIHFLECLFESGCRPKNVLVIGNAFGWSALALGFLLQDAVVVAMDAGLEGEATLVGSGLTRTIAAEEGIAVQVVEALSPRDVSRVVASQFGHATLDFVLVDGLHTNEQLLRDYEAVAQHASADCVFVFHDVLSWHMVEAFNSLRTGPTRERRILTRCPSGMGIVFPVTIDPDVRDVIDGFCDATIDLPEFHAALGASAGVAGPTLSKRLADGWNLRRLCMASTYEIEGLVALAQGQLALAAAEAHDDAETQFQIAGYQIDRGRWRDAEIPLRRARQLAPAWEAPPQQLSRVLRELGRHAEARVLLEEASTLRPDWAVLQYDLGCVVQMLDGDAASVSYFERASMLNPDWAAPHCELGVIRYRLGEDAAAIERLERAVAIDSRLAPACHVLGLATGRRHGSLAAVPWLERAVALDPLSAFIQYDLGFARFHLEDDQSAIAHMARAVVIAPDWAPPYYIMGLAKRRSEGDLAAAPSLERAVTLDPTWAQAWRESGSCAARLERWKDAWVRLTRAADLGHADQTLWYDIAVACAKAHEWTRALEAFREVSRTTPGSCAPDKEIGICLRALGRLNESAAILSLAIAAQPEWAGAHFELGHTYEALHEWERAERSFRRASQLRPAWQEAQDALARTRNRGVAVSATQGPHPR